MTDVENNDPQDNLQSAPKSRAHDHGPDHLPDMAPFVTLVRKVRRPLLIQSLLTSIAPDQPLPPFRAMASKPAVLSPAERDRLFQTVATFEEETRAALTLSISFEKFPVESVQKFPADE